VTVRLVDADGIPLDVATPLAGQLGMTLESWAEFLGVPDHVWSNIRPLQLLSRAQLVNPSLVSSSNAST
jgi:hypothetical protein